MTSVSNRNGTALRNSGRAGAIAASVLMHAAAGLLAVDLARTVTYDVGASGRAFRVDNAIALTSVVELGTDLENSAAVEPVAAAPERASARTPETKPPDLPVVGSATSSSSQIDTQTPAETLSDPTPNEATLAHAEPPAAAREAKEARTRASAQALNGGDAKALARYHGVLARKLQQARVLPRQRAGGRVLVRFKVAPSGELLSREVTHSSGQAVLDEAALASIDRAAPFPPIPSETSAGPLTLTVPFDYVVR